MALIHYTEYDYSQLKNSEKVWKKRKEYGRYYINRAFSFDIETTLIKLNDKTHRSFMYIWQFGIDGRAVFGRTWEEFKDFLSRFKNALGLDGITYAIVYIHNAGYEFEFLYSVIKINELFARSTHNPIYFDCDEFSIEFRDSYILSGLKLAKTAENLTKHKIEKLNGDDYQYNLIRHSKTKLTPLELKYCENDVLILNYFIREEMEYNGNIAKIPLTRTGYARRRFLQALKENKTFWKQWKKFITRTYPTHKQYCLLNKCFSGGYVHGNCNYIGLAVEDVTSIDISSSYPYQMCARKYPLDKWIEIDVKTLENREYFEKLMSNNAVMCEIMFKDIKAKTPHHIISRSKCIGLDSGVYDNGRVVSAKFLRTYITDVDYKIIKMFYTFDKVMIFEMYINTYDYLPKPFVNEVLNLYEIKTKLKGVEGKEEEYLRGKGDLNAGYGMVCTNVINPAVTFANGEWSTQKQYEIDIDEMLSDNQKSNGYFMPYAVGVWVTAYARLQLLELCYIIDKDNETGDIIYNDTDSIKMKNYSKHKKVIEEYNKKLLENIDNVMKERGFDVERTRPKTIKGEVKQMGVFEIDNKYQLFKTLGCKRYCYMIDNEFHHTASGIPQGKPDEYIIKEAKRQNKHPFDIFSFGLEIPANYSGNLTHYCYNDSMKLNITDYQGNTEKVNITSCCALVPQSYQIASNKEFLEFLSGYVVHRQFSVSTPQIGSAHPDLKIKSID